MSQYIPSCNSCQKLGDIGQNSSVLGVLEFGLAMYGVYALLTSKTVSKLIAAKSKRRRRR